MIVYDESWIVLLVFRYKGSVSQKAVLFAIPSVLVTIFLELIDDYSYGFRDRVGISDLSSTVLWTASTGVLFLMLNVRTNRAISRFWEGTGLLHQMRGEWFDSVSCCVTFSTTALDKKPEQVMQFRHTIVRLMSLCHASALAEISEKATPPASIDWLGLNDETLLHLRKCKDEYKFNRVEVLLHMTQTLIVNALAENVLEIPPPILSRVFQTISRGFVNLLNAKKITDTRFPFPYAQTISALLLLHVFLTPIMMSAILDSTPWAAIFTFVSIFGMFSLNYVAIELENPFGDDDNDLPLLHFQGEMNKCMLMLLEDNADHIPGTHPRHITHFDTLQHVARRSLDYTTGARSRVSTFDPYEGNCSGGLDSDNGSDETPADITQRLEALETDLNRSVQALETTFTHWMGQEAEHAKALAENTEAISNLVISHV